MFTGIISNTGVIKRLDLKKKNQIEIKSDFTSKIKIGESIACAGICLTVFKRNRNCFFVNVSEETIIKTNILDLKVGDSINLEKSIKVGDDISGHMVFGHIDGVSEVKKIDSTQEFAKIEVVEDEQESGEGEIRKIIQQLPKFESTTPDGKINVFNLEADEEGRFVTETLAEIYFNQRVFDKAIKAYEILSLKYPEKSSFFADRIRAIKKEKNS